VAVGTFRPSRQQRCHAIGGRHHDVGAGRGVVCRLVGPDLGQADGVRVVENRADAAIGRLTRGFLAVGNRYTVLAGGGRQRTADHPDTDARPTEPVRALFRRGIAEGALRADLTPEMLSVLYSGLIKAALETTAGGRVGTEEASAAVITVFLDGTRVPGVSYPR
jgi:hypothetical protein